MAENPPIRPQRGMVRTNRETTGGLLMSVIRSLTTSRDSADRDRERAELEKGFEQCDQKLNELVALHNNDLYQVMNTFSKILSNLGHSKERLLDTREKLHNCKKLLHCKRDELKKLWLELVENRAVLNLLERVEEVAKLPMQVDSFCSKKHFLHAAQCCVDGLRQLGSEEQDDSNSVGSGNNLGANIASKTRYNDSCYGSLSKIAALSEVRAELLAKKELLFESSIDELHRHLYLISSADVRKRFHRTGSFRQPSSSTIVNNDMSAGDFPHEPRSRKVSAIELMASTTSDFKKMFLQDANSDSKESEASFMLKSIANNNQNNSFDDYPEEDSRQFLTMLSKCLGLLNKIPDAVEIIKERCDNEFINVVAKSAQEILTSSGSSSGTLMSSASSVTRSNSFLDVSSTSSDYFPGNGMSDSTPKSNYSHLRGSEVKSLTQQQLVILTCTSLLGHSYNGYSHLHSSNPSVTVDGLTISHSSSSHYLPKSSKQLKEFFEMLLQQYRTIVSLHEQIILPNLKRIESGLHPFPDNENDDGTDSNQGSTNFYTSAELWSKIQMLVQQLLDFYLDATNLPNSNALNTNIGSNISTLLSPTFPFFFNSSTNNPSASLSSNANSAALPTDYSSYFSKRRALAGAMNAVNVMTKNTMTAVSSAGSNTDSANVPGSTSTLNSTATLSATGGSNLQSSHSTSNFLSSVVGSNASRTNNNNNLSLFKFDRSSQAISWNTFLAEQHHLSNSGSSHDDGNKNMNDDSVKDKDDDELKESYPMKPTSVTPSINHSKLFESLRSICEPSIDNLVLVYGPLMKYALQCPPFEDTSGGLSMMLQSAGKLQNQEGNTLYAYLLAAAEKFSSHVNIQLEKMLETASKSLEVGTTVSIAHLSPLYSNNATLEEHNESNGAVNPELTSSANKSQQQTYQQQQQNLKLYPPLLESAVLVDVSTHNLRTLMQAVPDYSNDFLGYICNVLNAFKDLCLQTYRGIVHPTTGPSSGMSASVSTIDISSSSSYSNVKRIISATWAKDEDINRLIKSLPNWSTLQEYKKQSLVDRSPQSSSIMSKLPTSNNSRRKIKHQMSSFDESPEEVRLRNMRETEILISNLSQEIPKHELLWQDGQLCTLAQLQESFEWISVRCEDLVNSIMSMQQCQQTDYNGIELDRNLSEVYIATLNQLTKDFADLAETCLLVLHLEVRVHCFYHLQVLDSNFFTTPAPQFDSDGQTARTGQELFSDDSKIIPLLNDLRRMHDELENASLKPFKMVYIFEGLGHLITTIFINSASQIRRVKPNGIKRACRAIYDIQRRLTAITKSRELALDYARQYFELFLLTPDEIMATIIERGRQFPHREYVTAITLLHQSGLASATSSSSSGGASSGLDLSPHNSNLEMERNLKRLNDILNEVTVTL